MLISRESYFRTVCLMQLIIMSIVVGMFSDVGCSHWFRMLEYCQRSSTSFDVRVCTLRKMA